MARPRTFKNKDLSQQQKDFIKHYIKSGGQIEQSAIKAGYAPANASSQGSKLMRNPKVLEEIDRYNRNAMSRAVASSAEVMQFLTRAMNGEIKDQFGLDATLSDRIKAAVELAKRTVDIEQRTQNNTPQISVTLDWRK